MMNTSPYSPMDTSKKIGGSVTRQRAELIRSGEILPDSTSSFYTGKDCGKYDVPATLVVFEKGREEVFTASEVKALFRKLPIQAFIGEPVVRVQDIEDFLTLQGL